MIVLALETATSVCSVALFRGGRTRVLLSLHRPRAHAEHLVPMLRDVLEYEGLRPSDVNGVAVSSGPGSYTGLRIGASTAKGIASAVGADLVAVPSLYALADRVRPFASRNDLIAAAFDARRDEVYAALYRLDADTALVVERDTQVLEKTAAAQWLDVGGSPILVGEAWDKVELDSSYRRIRGEAGLPSADAVARIGAEMLARGETSDVVRFEPYYLKEFVATKPRTTAFEKLSF